MLQQALGAAAAATAATAAGRAVLLLLLLLALLLDLAHQLQGLHHGLQLLLREGLGGCPKLLLALLLGDGAPVLAFEQRLTQHWHLQYANIRI
jgi:hypothetical protein